MQKLQTWERQQDLHCVYSWDPPQASQQCWVARQTPAFVLLLVHSADSVTHEPACDQPDEPQTKKKTLLKRNTLREGRCLQLVPLGQVSACTHFPGNTTALLTATFYCCYFIYFRQRSQIQIDGSTIHPRTTADLPSLDLPVVLMGIKLAVAQNRRAVELYNASNMTTQGRKVPCFNHFLGFPQECNSLWLGLPHSCVPQCLICFQTGLRKDNVWYAA